MATLFPVPTIIYSKGRLLDITKPVVMGILNATPNSFYNKGRASDIDNLLRNAEIMLQEGAAILDIGGASTKPGEPLIQPDAELGRILPVVTAIHQRFPEAWLSIDTYNAVVAKEAIGAGASIINDISAGEFDKEMLATVANLKVPYIAMHIQGTPQTMQKAPNYTNVLTEVCNHLQQVCAICTAAGIKDIIIDPGFGFGKTVAHNYRLLNALNTLRLLGKPILAGLSRKSMVCRPLNLSPEYALNGTTALNMIALKHGANILRVHDVKEAVEVIKLSQL